jgi:aminoglycoside phosphotransferase (APT) family kinase protein
MSMKRVATMEPMGQLPSSDPLHALIASTLALSPGARLDVFALNGPDGAVYLYVDAESGQRTVGKFYGRKWIHDSRTGEPELRGLLLRREFDNLAFVRSLGFTAAPFVVPKPLAMSDDVDWVLLEEYAGGVNLHHCIWDAVVNGNTAPLDCSVVAAARFLRKLHDAASAGPVLPRRNPHQYLHKLLAQLRGWGILGEEEMRRLHGIGVEWATRSGLTEAPVTLIHGDATPEHLLWDEDPQRLGIIDFESLRLGDAAEDLGYLAAEIKHLFWSYTGDPWASEEFIRRLYAAYDGGGSSLTDRGRFFMGCAELRIARNVWLAFDYRRQLIAEAERCLTG